MARIRPWRVLQVKAGTRIRDWVVGDHLGEGHASSVFAADYSGISTRFPPKAALRFVTGNDPRRIEDISAAYNGAPLGDEIAEVYDLFEAQVRGQRVLVFVLELAAYSLDDVLRTTPISRVEVDQLAARMLGALGAYHEAGLYHGGVKPSNVLWCTGGWKLGDQGSSAPTSGNNRTTGALLHQSSPEYRPPEGLDDPESDRRHHDLWALAIVLNEAVSGQKPHASGHDRTAGVITVAPELSRKVSAFVHNALAAEPLNRPQHAGEVDLNNTSTPTTTKPVGGSTDVVPARRANERGRRNWLTPAARAALFAGVVGLVALAAMTWPGFAKKPDADRAAQAPQDTSPPATAVVAAPTRAPPLSSASVPETVPAATLPAVVAPVQITSNPQPTFAWESVQGASSYVILVDQRFFDGGSRTGVIDETLTSTEAGCAAGGLCQFTSPIPLGPAFEWWITANFSGTDSLSSEGTYVLLESQSFGSR